MAGLSIPIVEPSRFQVEAAEEYDGATAQRAGLNKPAWLHRGLGFLAGVAGFMLIAAVVFPSPSDTESPSGFSLASFTPAGTPAMRGTNAAATSSGQMPVMQMSTPVQRSPRIPTVPLRNTPPAMQMSSTAFDPLGLEASEESQATTAYAVPSSHINRMQPAQNIVNGDSGVSGSTLGWLSILALSTAGAYMAGKTVQSRSQRVEMSAAAATISTIGNSFFPQRNLSRAVAVTMSTQEAVHNAFNATQDAAATHNAFVFIKPHAVCDNVKSLVDVKMASSGIKILSSGTILGEKIDKDQLIDTHYGAIAAKAVKLKPDALNVQPKAQEAFEKAFGTTWGDAIKEGQVYNAMDAAKKLGLSSKELGDKCDALEKGVDLLKFGGGFYCAKIDGIYVINAFYMAMREKFTTPSASIHYYDVQWNAKDLSWADFRDKVLGGTDPKTAYSDSARHMMYEKWESLGLESCPNTGDNGVHASASPFEALAERCNWLGVDPEDDSFGKALLSTGVPLEMLKAWCDDPQVSFDGKKQSLFDLLEDTDAGDCLKKGAAIAEANR
jgi:hypothetical protein